MHERRGYVQRFTARYITPAPDDNTQLAEKIARRLISEQSQARKRQNKRIVISMVLCLVFVAGVVIANNLYQRAQLTKLVPTSIKQQVPFEIVIPSSSDIRPMISSFVYSADVLSYQVRDNQTDYTVIVQPLPPNFEITNYATGQGMSGARSFDTPDGTALLGSVNNKDIFIYSRESVLITGVATSTASYDQRINVVRNMKSL